MAKPEAFWINLHNQFDPEEVLVGERAREFYCEREHSPYDHMRLDFRKAINPGRRPIAFFTGHRGSGKSSMLLRLLERFAAEYFIVYFDVEHNLDSQKANQIDLLYLLGATIYKVAKDEGASPDAQLVQALGEAIFSITQTAKRTKKEEKANYADLAKGVLGFGASMLGIGFAEKLADAALKPFSLSSGVSEEEARKREIEPQVQEIINQINLIIGDVETKVGKPILVIVDGLDKLQRLEQAKLIFIDSRALRTPLCRIVYTVPMLVYTSLPFGQAEEECKTYLLLNIKLYEEHNRAEKYTPGYEKMREVVSKRLAPLELKLEDVFEPHVLDRLILKSGGILRWLISLVNDSLTEAELNEADKVNLDAAQAAIANRAVQLESRLNSATKQELQKVYESKMTSGDPISSELLHGLLIVAYRNGSAWFDVHPLLWDAIGGEVAR